MSYTPITVAIRARLIAVSAVNNLISARIYPSILPQNVVLPAITYQVLSDMPVGQNLSGSAGLFNAVIQLDLYHNNYILLKGLSEQVRLALQGYKGTVSTVIILGIYLTESEVEDFEQDVNNYRLLNRFSIWYHRTDPA